MYKKFAKAFSFKVIPKVAQQECKRPHKDITCSKRHGKVHTKYQCPNTIAFTHEDCAGIATGFAKKTMIEQDKDGEEILC